MGDSLRDRSGFTLIELSIVLVIIGLIVGGVLVGRDLIHAATLRSVLTDIDKFNAAVMTFQGKYNCLPGDCVNAKTFFGAYSDCSSGAAIPPNSGTCNGDGDNKVMAGSHSDNNASYDETTLFWQQLSLAGLVQGNYGVSYVGGTICGGQGPAAKLDKGCFSINYSETAADWIVEPQIPWNAHFFRIGSVVMWEGIESLMAVDAYGIDKKVDDGAPFTGSVRAPEFVIYSNLNIVAHGGCLKDNGTGMLGFTYDSTTAYTPCELFLKAAF